jgi:Abortive infection bacteriophage resistance protein
MKKATNVDEQIEILKSRGITIGDEQKAYENLLDIGYFRLGFYCFPFEKTHPKKNNRTHEYVNGTKFDDIVKLYYFDVDLRNILTRYINRIEINFRTYLIYTVSNKYIDSPTWFVDPAVVSNSFIDDFDKKIYNYTFKQISVIKCHHQYHINDRYAPAWKTIEFMTFSSILILFQKLKDRRLKYDIAQHYGLKSVSAFENYMEAICKIRNACAHSNVLLDIALPQSIITGPAGRFDGANKHNLLGAVTVIEYMLSRVSNNRATDLNNQLNELLKTNKVPGNVKRVIEKCSGFQFPE